MRGRREGNEGKGIGERWKEEKGRERKGALPAHFSNAFAACENGRNV